MRLVPDSSPETPEPPHYGKDLKLWGGGGGGGDSHYDLRYLPYRRGWGVFVNVSACGPSRLQENMPRPVMSTRAPLLQQASHFAWSRLPHQL